MIVVRRQHDLGLAAARRLAENVARRLQREHGGTFSWEGNELVFQRTGASGRLAVTKDRVEVSLQLSLLLRPLQSRIEREIDTFLDEQVGPAARRDGAPASAADSKRVARAPAVKRH